MELIVLFQSYRLSRNSRDIGRGDSDNCFLALDGEVDGIIILRPEFFLQLSHALCILADLFLSLSRINLPSLNACCSTASN